MTWDVKTIIISLGMIKSQEIQPHNVTNCTIKQIRSSTIKRSIHHLTSILPTTNGNHLHIVLNLRITGSLLPQYRSPQQQSKATPSPQLASDLQDQMLKFMSKMDQIMDSYN
jgi:hypothetical protein